MDYYEHVCWDPSGIGSIRLGFKNEWGQTRALTFEVDDKVLLIETREVRSALDWKYLKGIHLRTNGDNQTSMSIEIVKQGGTETRMVEGGYVSHDCLRRLVAKIGSVIKVRVN
ncbi:hypothetical protein [Taklimakanibacter lacteus]|uniref:hypothetical protein n=1 Tax=Taklimakanibacter lacteus TaxID=2268456 RepID=UPI0013C50577